MSNKTPVQRVRGEVVISLDAKIAGVIEDINSLMKSPVVNSEDLTMFAEEIKAKCITARAYLDVLNSIDKAQR